MSQTVDMLLFNNLFIYFITMAFTVIIPALNEEKGIEEVIRRCKAILSKGDEIIVVDDGSTDRTYSIAKRAGVRVIKHKVNKGKAFALKTGFSAAKNDILVTIDADCTYPPEAIPAIVERLDNADLVVGSRFKQGIPKGLPMHRSIANIIGAEVTSIILSRRLTDVTTGLRAFRKKVILDSPVKAKGLDFEAEFTARAITKKYRYAEVPIVAEERKGQSSLRFFRHIYLFSIAVLRGRFFN